MDRLNIRTKNRKFETAKDLYGIFFEDINRAGDGGIYPEMIRNRCFEDSLLPEGYTQRADGVHVVTDSGWEDEFNGGEGLSSWVEEDQIEKTSVPGWYAQDARMRLEQADTLNKNRKAALNVRFEKGGSIWNIGFCGIPQKKGEAYKFCLFAKTAQETKLEVSVIENNVCFASTTLLLKGNGYVKYDAVLAATGDSQNAKLIFRCPDGGEILFGFTSLMPGTTYNGHGLRALFISFKTGIVATVISFFLGLFAARKVIHAGERAKAIADGFLTLPMVLPPTVAGFFLLLLFSKRRPIGMFLFHQFGIKVVQTWLGCIIAATVISFPLMYRNARASFEQLDANLIYAARTLGMSELQIFWKVAVPNAGPGIIAGTILTFARALGEYGATSMLAGNIPGKTSTISQKIAMVIQDGDYLTAGVWVIIILAIAFGIIVAMNLVAGKNMKNTQSW